jgi:hypothetical protein
MALVTAVGGSLSDSFVSVTEASTILSAAPFSTSTWSSLPTTNKENLLRYAALAMEFLPWRGWRVRENQALCYPRTYQSDTDIIPQDIKDAQAYVAYLVIKRGLVGVTAPETGVSGQSVTSVSLGGLLSVGFGSQNVSGSVSGLTQLILSPDFPVHLKIARHMATIRYRGNGDRPDLLPEITA